MQLCQITLVCYFCPDPGLVVMSLCASLFNISRFHVMNANETFFLFKIKIHLKLFFIKSHISRAPFRLSLLLCKRSLDERSVNLIIIAPFFVQCASSDLFLLMLVLRSC